MIEILDKKKCCGCTACASICPIQCIEMKKDEEGFEYPIINMQKCMKCGACIKVCPIGKQQPDGEVIEAYVVQDKRFYVRETSSSGGAFTAIAEYVITKGGTVYGATYDDRFLVFHTGVNKAEELLRFRSSKYVQSNVTGVYSEIRKRLINCEWVLFSGTPCQVAGLKSYLQREWDTLITVDVACHGVPSPKLWEIYLEWWKDYKKCDFRSIEFRSKKYGYSGSTMRLVFEDGSEYSCGELLQFYKNAMFAGLSLRPSCYECHFKTIARVSDYTIFDCWDVNMFCSEMDDDFGTTALLIQSEKGKKLLAEINDAWIMNSVNPNLIIKNDGDMITQNACINPKREEFFLDLCIYDVPEINKKYFPFTIKRRVVQILKPILFRMGLLNKLKRKLK